MWGFYVSPVPGGALSGVVTLADPKYFSDNNGIIAPIGASCLYGVSDRVEPRFLLDYYAEKIHHVRLFVGRLTPSSTRTGQTPEAARDRLPQFIEWCRERKLRVEVTCCTDTLEGDYDEEFHCREVAGICTSDGRRESVIGIEVWNEIGHSTQRAIAYEELMNLKDVIAEWYDGPIALGASSIDELDVDTGLYPSGWTGRGAFNTMHLDRGRTPSYVQSFRVKEFYDIRNTHSSGSCNNEPARFDDSMFAGEHDGRGNERFGYILGSLCAAWSFMSNAHGSQMRDAVASLTGVEANAFSAYLRGASVIPRGQYTWKNANNTGNWPDSPIKNGSFADGPANDGNKALWRAYSYLSNEISFVIAGGANPAKFNLEYQNGYHPIGMIDEFPGVQIIQIAQG